MTRRLTLIGLAAAVGLLAFTVARAVDPPSPPWEGAGGVVDLGLVPNEIPVAGDAGIQVGVVRKSDLLNVNRPTPYVKVYLNNTWVGCVDDEGYIPKSPTSYCTDLNPE